VSFPHVVVVGGVPCVGKSHLVERHLEVLRALLRDDGPLHGQDPIIITMKEFESGTRPANHPMVLHYDLVRNHEGLDNRRLALLIPSAERTTFLTLVASSSTLARRHNVRLRSLVRAAIRPGFYSGSQASYRLRRHLRLAILYRRPSALRRLHAEWFRFGAGISRHHFVALGEPSATPRLCPIDPLRAAESLEAGAGPPDLLSRLEAIR
jgi:hypothetical protein